MKRRTVKSMAVALSVILTGSLMGGCGTKQEQTTGGEQTQTEDGKMTLELWTTNGEVANNSDSFYINKIEDAFDINIKVGSRPVGSGTDYSDWLTLSMASGEAPDWFRDQSITVAQLTDYVEQGLVAELDPEMVKENMPNLMAYYEKYADVFGDDPLSLYAVDGKIYSIPDAIPNLGEFTLMCIRQDWLDNLNLQMPETLDEFYDVMYAFTYDDPDGDGVDDTYGFEAIYKNPTWAFGPIFGAYGIYPGIFYSEEGKVTRGELNVERMKEALTFIKKMCDDGIVDPEWMTLDYSDSQNKVVSSIVGCCWQNWLSILTDTGWYAPLKDTVPESSWAISGGPVGPHGDNGMMQFNPLAGVGLVFTKQMEEQPEKLAKYLQVFDTICGNPDEWYEALIWGEKDKTFIINENGDREYTAEYQDEKARFEYGFGADYQFPSLEVFMYDPDTTENITYDKATMERREESLQVITGPHDELSSFNLPVYNELKIEMPDLEVALTEFITGQRDIEEYDEWLQEWMDAGGEEIMKEAQEVYDAHY